MSHGRGKEASYDPNPREIQDFFYVVTHACIVDGNLPIFDLIVHACYPGDATWRLNHGSLTRMSNVERLRTESTRLCHHYKKPPMHVKLAQNT
jgi:hypothetical protein